MSAHTMNAHPGRPVMTRSTAVVATALVALLATAPGVRAQTSVFLGLGSTFPLGTLTSSGPFAGANVGWQGTIGVRHFLGSSPFALGARVFYGGNGYEGPQNEDSKLRGVTALATWALAEGPVSPFVWSEAGFLSHKYSAASGGLLGGPTESSEEAFLLAGGLGVGAPLGAAEGLVLGGYAHGLGVFDDIRYFVLTAAIGLPIS